MVFVIMLIRGWWLLGLGSYILVGSSHGYYPILIYFTHMFYKHTGSLYFIKIMKFSIGKRNISKLVR